MKPSANPLSKSTRTPGIVTRLNARRPAGARISNLMMIAVLALFGTACDSIVSGEGPEEPGIEITSAEFSSTSDIIKVHFNAPLVESTVVREAFRIFSVYDNNSRTGSFGPESVRYLGGASNTVELNLWGDNGLGSGEHALIVTGVEDVDGRANDIKYSFTHRVTVKTPKSFIVRKIVIHEFPTTDSVGNDWDDLSSGADIRLSFQRPNATPIYVSETYDDASPTSQYTFGDAASYDDPGLPFEVDYKTEYVLNLIDADFGGDEMMVAADIRLSSLYRLNNATADELTVTLRRPKFKAVLHGDWTYTR